MYLSSDIVDYPVEPCLHFLVIDVRKLLNTYACRECAHVIPEIVDLIKFLYTGTFEMLKKFMSIHK